MGLTRWATRRPHLLLVEVPGWWSTRVEVERLVRERGWALGPAPADADAVVVCGRPAAAWGELVERVWDQLPGPRARSQVVTPADAGSALDDVLRQLRDSPGQVADARDRPCATAQLDDDTGHDAGDVDDGHRDDRGRSDGGAGRGEVDHAATGGGGVQEGHSDGGGMDMAPFGIPLASGAPGRDGLELDVLHLPLGPVLPHWPAGLVLHCTLSGDVVTTADVELLAGASSTTPSPQPQQVAAARHVDAAARLLALAGADDEYDRLRRVRDALCGGDDTAARALLARSFLRVRRSTTLRWMLRGLGRVTPDQGRRSGLPSSVVGDVHDRLVAMLDDATALLDGHDARPVAGAGTVTPLLPPLVAGLDLATVRLVVASLDVRLDRAPDLVRG